MYTIAEPLAEIINKMFELGCFPDQLKIAKVIPLFKKGNTNELANYRPVSLLTNF